MGSVQAIGRLLVLTLAAVASLGSASRNQTHVPSADERPTPAVIITTGEAVRLGLRGQRVNARFGTDPDLTKLAYKFLDAASARGAGWASDLEIHVSAGTADQPMDCVTRFEARPMTGTVMEPELVQKPPETRLVMKPVIRTVTDMEYRCHLVSRPHTETRTTYESHYDFGCKCTRSRPVSRTVHTTRMENECRHEPRTRVVTDQEMRVEQHTPAPEWQTVPREGVLWPIVESQPSCAPRAPEDEGGGNWASGLIWFQP